MCKPQKKMYKIIFFSSIPKETLVLCGSFLSLINMLQRLKHFVQRLHRMVYWFCPRNFKNFKRYVHLIIRVVKRLWEERCVQNIRRGNLKKLSLNSWLSFRLCHDLCGISIDKTVRVTDSHWFMRVRIMPKNALWTAPRVPFRGVLQV